MCERYRLYGDLVEKNWFGDKWEGLVGLDADSLTELLDENCCKGIQLERVKDMDEMWSWIRSRTVVTLVAANCHFAGVKFVPRKIDWFGWECVWSWIWWRTVVMLYGVICHFAGVKCVLWKIDGVGWEPSVTPTGWTRIVVRVYNWKEWKIWMRCDVGYDREQWWCCVVPVVILQEWSLYLEKLTDLVENACSLG